MPSVTTLRRLVGGAYAAIGVVAAIDPVRVPAVFGGAASTAEARTEVRAVYAGIPLAFATSVALGPADDGVLRTVRNASAGMAVARLAGSAVEGRLRLWPTGAFLALEAALALAAHRACRTVPETSDTGHAT